MQSTQLKTMHHRLSHALAHLAVIGLALSAPTVWATEPAAANAVQGAKLSLPVLVAPPPSKGKKSDDANAQLVERTLEFGVWRPTEQGASQDPEHKPSYPVVVFTSSSKSPAENASDSKLTQQFAQDLAKVGVASAHLVVPTLTPWQGGEGSRPCVAATLTAGQAGVIQAALSSLQAQTWAKPQQMILVGLDAHVALPVATTLVDRTSAVRAIALLGTERPEPIKGCSQQEVLDTWFALGQAHRGYLATEAERATPAMPGDIAVWLIGSNEPGSPPSPASSNRYGAWQRGGGQGRIETYTLNSATPETPAWSEALMRFLARQPGFISRNAAQTLARDPVKDVLSPRPEASALPEASSATGQAEALTPAASDNLPPPPENRGLPPAPTAISPLLAPRSGPVNRNPPPPPAPAAPAPIAPPDFSPTGPGLSTPNIPHASARDAQEIWRRYREIGGPKAMVISPSGLITFGVGPAAQADAVARCQQNGNRRCEVFAVDDRIVWTPGQ